MTKWLESYNVFNTEELLGLILRGVLAGDRVMFLCEPGSGKAVVQRNRVMLSRSRNRNKARGRKIKYFRLNSTIHPHTDKAGKRWDCVVMWAVQTQSNQFDELLDDLIQSENL